MYNLIETSTGVFSITDENGKNAGSYNLQHLITAIGKPAVENKLGEFNGNDVKAFLDKLEKDHLKSISDDLKEDSFETALNKATKEHGGKGYCYEELYKEEGESMLKEFGCEIVAAYPTGVYAGEVGFVYKPTKKYIDEILDGDYDDFLF